jgi:hypothetical protein
VDGYQLNLFCCKSEQASLLEEQGLLVTSVVTPDHSGDDHKDIWPDHLRGFPYAVTRMAGWTENKSSPGYAGAERYHRALDRHARAHDAEVPLALRYTCLRESLVDAEAAVGERTSIPRLQTLTRLMWELGQRVRAVESLARLLETLEKHQAVLLDEPFLAVSPRFERLDPGADIFSWCLASALEQHERLRAYSSYFSDLNGLANLEKLASLGFATPEMERRRQLVRMRHGLQDGPQPHPALTSVAAENLNPRYWQSRSTP